jgi:hypothetical protein
MADFPSPNSAYGRWGLMDVRDAIMGGNWPSTPVADPYFPYVTMLLPGNGTNGAQNNTFLDSSTNNFTITRNGNTTQGSFSPYGSNWSNYFDGSGDYLSTPSSITLGSGDLTIEGWAYPTNTSGGVFYDFRGPDSGSAGNNPVIQWSTVTASKFTVRIDGTNAITSSSTFSTNNWHHVALVRSGTTVTLYVNGTSQGTYTTSTSFAQAYVRIGAYGGDGSVAFTGYASNLRAVIGTAIYTATFTPPTTPLTAVSGTALLTCQSNRFVDNSSNSYTITSTGNTSVQRFSPFSPTAAYSTSVIGGSGYFDGSGDYLTCSASVPATGAFTVEMFLYPTSTAGYQLLLSQFTSGNAGNFQVLWDDTTDKFTVNLGASTVLTSSTTFPLNAWYHLAITRDGSNNMTMWVNGASAATTTNSTSILQTTTYIASRSALDGYFNGYLSNIRVTNTAVYTTAFTPPTAPLTAISGTSLLTNFTNGAIIDNAMMNDLETVGNAQISTSVKKYGTGSIAFDGTGDYLSGPTTPTTALGSGAYTVEFWLYKDSTGSGERGIFQTQTASLYGLSIFADGTTIYIDERKNAFDGSDPRISGTISQDTWIYITVCRETGTSGTLRAFVNGTQIGSSVTSNLRNLTSTGPIIVGNTATATNPLKGYIDDLRITNGIARYTTTFTPPTQALSTF